MFAEAINRLELLLGPLAALIIFFVFMLGTLAWVLRPKSGELYVEISRKMLVGGEGQDGAAR